LYRVVYSPECKEEVRELRAYITTERSRRIADAYIARLKSFCKGLALAPHRGESRPELEESLRTIGFEHRISVVFRVYDDQQFVRVIGIRYGGRQINTSS